MMLYHICPKPQPPCKNSFTPMIFQSISLFEKNTKIDAIIWWYLGCQNNREWSERKILSIPYCSQLSQKEERAGGREEGRGKWCFSHFLRKYCRHWDTICAFVSSLIRYSPRTFSVMDTYEVLRILQWTRQTGSLPFRNVRHSKSSPMYDEITSNIF